MRDIPIFTTQYGVASLTLKEIPYTLQAYIKIQDSRQPKQLLDECICFCRGAGAESVYASGHDYLEAFPLHTWIWRMSCLRASLPDTNAALFPMQQETMEQWRLLYNEKMRAIPNASYLTMSDAEKMLCKGSCYFIHSGDTLLGIGSAHDDQIDVIASIIPGAGRDIVLALNHALSSDTVYVEVASVNTPAVRLYEKMGFTKSNVIAKWFHVM